MRQEKLFQFFRLRTIPSSEAKSGKIYFNFFVFEPSRLAKRNRERLEVGSLRLQVGSWRLEVGGLKLDGVQTGDKIGTIRSMMFF